MQSYRVIKDGLVLTFLTRQSSYDTMIPIGSEIKVDEHSFYCGGKESITYLHPLLEIALSKHIIEEIQ